MRSKYSFEKRKKEKARQQKQLEKKLRRAEAKQNPMTDEQDLLAPEEIESNGESNSPEQPPAPVK